MAKERFHRMEYALNRKLMHAPCEWAIFLYIKLQEYDRR